MKAVIIRVLAEQNIFSAEGVTGIASVELKYSIQYSSLAWQEGTQ